MKTTYTPQRLDTSRIELPAGLLAQTEQMAKNIHDVWAALRLSEGWKYGAERNDKEKTTPCLVPYDELTENEKEYDRKTAMETLKVIKLLGFEIVNSATTHLKQVGCSSAKAD